MKLARSTFSGLIGIISYLLGGIDSLLLTLLIVIVLDYLTGIAKAFILKELNSKTGLKGIIKKCGYIFIVVLSVQADALMGYDITPIRAIVIYSFITNESISILENWALIGLPLPQKLLETFSTLKDTSKNDKNY